MITVCFSFVDSLRRHIDYLKELGVETLVLKYVLKANPETPQDVMNFTEVAPVLQNSEEFKQKVIEYAKQKSTSISTFFSKMSIKKLLISLYFQISISSSNSYLIPPVKPMYSLEH